MTSAPPPTDWVNPARRREKAEKIADWCAAEGYDPAVQVDPKLRRWIVREALGVTLRPDGKKRYPHASEDTWAEAVRVYDARRHAQVFAR